MSSPKFSTREGQLSLVLAPTVKVLPRLRDLFPHSCIAGWKYELAGTAAEAFEKAWQQLRENRTDACVLNGAAYGAGFAFCTPDHAVRKCADNQALADWLGEWLEKGK